MAKVTVENSIAILAPRAEVFRFVATWQNAWRYTPHVANLEQLGPIQYGLGTRLRGRVSLGAHLPKHLPLETVSEVAEFVDGERIVCRSIKGAEIANTWLFKGDETRTILIGILSCRIPGRFIGRVVAALCSQWLVDSLTSSLLRLKQILEDRPPVSLSSSGADIPRLSEAVDLAIPVRLEG